MDPEGRIVAAVKVLRAHGVPFAYLFGSMASGTARSDSDVDIAAVFPDPMPQSYEVDMPDGVDLLVLNKAPLELAGRIALEGTLLYADDEATWARWVSTTRKIYLDERPRIERAHRDFLDSVSHG